MATFLALAQQARDECEIPGSGPATTKDSLLTGQHLRIVRYVRQAWTEIQNAQSAWRWMRVGFTLQTVASDDKYAFGDATDDETSLAISRFARWRLNDRQDPPRIYLTASGASAEYWLTYISYESWRQVYQIASQTDSQPAHITVDPQNNIRFGPAPNDIYTLSGDYMRGAHIMDADDQEPDMPVRFHDLIVYGAMIKWGYYAVAPELVERGSREYRRMMGDLRIDQLPQMRLGSPLA